MMQKQAKRFNVRILAAAVLSLAAACSNASQGDAGHNLSGVVAVTTAQSLSSGYQTIIAQQGTTRTTRGFVVLALGDSRHRVVYDANARTTAYDRKKLPMLCYDGNTPQIALRSDGRAMACISGIQQHLLFLITPRGKGLSVTELAHDASAASFSGLAFLGDTDVEYLRRNDRCPAANPYELGTEAVRINIVMKTNAAIGCAVALVPTLQKPALVRTQSGAYQYSLDDGVTWKDGWLAFMAGDKPFFWGGKAESLKDADGHDLLTFKSGISVTYAMR